MLLVLVGAGWAYYLSGNRGPNIIALHSEEKVLVDTLPDGSVVTLNKQSSISYAGDFEGE